MKIKEIILFSNQLEKQKVFYEEVLGFELIKYTTHQISFKTGASILSFQYKENTIPSHLAFNIPSFQEEEAFNWLKERAAILDFEGEQILDFKSWNSKAIYFYDADKNIMEFIARKNLNIIGNLQFSEKSIISISEMAIATENIEKIYKKINAIHEISLFDGDFDRFCAIGNEEGLFIIIDKNKKTWYPTMEIADTSDFIIKGDYNFSFENGIIKELL